MKKILYLISIFYILWNVWNHKSKWEEILIRYFAKPLESQAEKYIYIATILSSGTFSRQLHKVTKKLFGGSRFKLYQH